MGLFDFLKVTVADKKTAKPAGRMPVSVVQCDGKSFPILSLTPKGFVARGFDGSLVVGQNAKVSVRVDDAAGKFTFNATVSVVEIKGDTVGATCGPFWHPPKARIAASRAARRATKPDCLTLPPMKSPPATIIPPTGAPDSSLFNQNYS